MSPNVSAVSISDRWIRIIVISLAVVAFISYETYVALRLRATYTNQADLARLRSELEDTRRRGGGALRVMDQRISALETSVYGELEPANAQHQDRPRVIVQPREQWSVNRERDLRERLERLERWRMEQDFLKQWRD